MAKRLFVLLQEVLLLWVGRNARHRWLDAHPGRAAFYSLGSSYFHQVLHHEIFLVPSVSRPACTT